MFFFLINVILYFVKGTVIPGFLKKNFVIARNAIDRVSACFVIKYI